MLLLNLILLISVTFSTPTPVYNNNPDVERAGSQNEAEGECSTSVRPNPAVPFSSTGCG